VTAAPVSVVIVSRGRPKALMRCLEGVARQDHPNYEIVVVADPTGIAAVSAWRGQIKVEVFDEANISKARNVGIGLAAGEVVAFIDDDAVPEPTWLRQLTAPFAQGDVAAAGGPVIGRNGISLQWGAATVDRTGQRRDLPVEGPGVTVHRGTGAMGIKTEGTNMAFRRDVMVQIGGFDARFAFYLDESDVNLRLGAMSARTAVVPGAVVHHGFAESDRRRADRVPLDLRQIGTSLAVFLRKHGVDPATRFAAEREGQRRRLMAHVVAGRIEGRDLRRLLDGFDAGWAEGISAAEAAAPDLSPRAAFLPFRSRATGRHVVITARPWGAGRARAEATTLAAEGDIVTVMILSPTAMYHQVAFDPAGYWVQRGGLFGRSLRSDPLFRFWRFRDRVAREADRVTPVRGPWTLP
jgi:GT2 family glycosyltransferase